MALNLGRVNDALAAQETSFQFWDRSFEHTEPPPPYSSGETTRYSSPEPTDRHNPPRMPAWFREACLRNSMPSEQFTSQSNREGDRIQQATLEKVRKGIIKFREINGGNSVDFRELGRKSVEADWRAQGIWIEGWTGNVNAMIAWKHQLPLDLNTDTESESEPEGQPQRSLFGLPSPRKKPHKELSAAKLLQKFHARLERERQQERDREASKPLRQFKHQVDKERKYIQEQIAHGKRRQVGDIDDLVYHTVRNWWIDQRIWFSKWQPLPGIQWMNEMPPEDVADEDAFTTLKHDVPDDALPESPAPFDNVSGEGIGTPSIQEAPLNMIEPLNGMEQVNGSQSLIEANFRRLDDQPKGNSRSSSPEIPPAKPALSVKRLRRAGRPSNSKATSAVSKATLSRDSIRSTRVVKRQKEGSRYHGSKDSDMSAAIKPQPPVELRRSERIKALNARVNQESLNTGNTPTEPSERPQPQHDNGHQQQSAGASKTRRTTARPRKSQNPKRVSPTARRGQNKTPATEAKPQGVAKKRAKKGRQKTATRKLN